MPAHEKINYVEFPASDLEKVRSSFSSVSPSKKRRPRSAAPGAESSDRFFSFPGGRWFHFIEPSGNEFAVWGEADA